MYCEKKNENGLPAGGTVPRRTERGSRTAQVSGWHWAEGRADGLAAVHFLTRLGATNIKPIKKTIEKTRCQSAALERMRLRQALHRAAWPTRYARVLSASLSFSTLAHMALLIATCGPVTVKLKAGRLPSTCTARTFVAICSFRDSVVVKTHRYHTHAPPLTYVPLSIYQGGARRTLLPPVHPKRRVQ